MIITKNIFFRNFRTKFKLSTNKKLKSLLLDNNNEIINSLKSSYKYSYSKKFIKSKRNFSILRLIGMGGSILGTKAIFSFLQKKNKKRDSFF